MDALPLLRRKNAAPTHARARRRLTVRFAGPADADAIARLARLDSSRVPRGEVLVAEVAGELWAALSLDDGHAVADPFRPSGELVLVLADRARALERDGRGGGRRLRRPRLAGARA